MTLEIHRRDLMLLFVRISSEALGLLGRAARCGVWDSPAKIPPSQPRSLLSLTTSTSDQRNVENMPSWNVDPTDLGTNHGEQWSAEQHNT